MEKVLTSEPDEFEKHLKENSSQLTEEEKNQPESYAYGEVKFCLIYKIYNLYILGLTLFFLVLVWKVFIEIST